MNTIAEPPYAALKKTEFRLFRDLIYQDAGISLNDSKFQLVESRLAKRLRALPLHSYHQYYDFLMNGDRTGEERLKMINCLTTNKTDFFREAHHFDYLKSDVFPAIEQRARITGQKRLRIWSAACSTGEEPYTLAMTILDYFGPMALKEWDIRILASDVDTDVIARAEAGLYAPDRVKDLPPETIRKHFVKTSRTPESPMQVSPALQSLITFRRINFVEPAWPVHTTFDTIFCRNVMIYFDETTQDRLLTRFAKHLNPDGRLFIGHSESILRLDKVFRSLGHTVYSLRQGDDPPSKPLPNSRTPLQAGTPEQAELSVDHKQRSPAAKADTQQGRVPSPSKPSRPSTAMVDPETEHRELPRHRIIVGEVKAVAEPSRVCTLVGSCIAVCLFDPKYKIGGVNHFMLPAGSDSEQHSATYGVHAMELLINELMKLGGDRRRFVAKIFGGGKVLGNENTPCSQMPIGDKNIKFATDFLQTDNIPLIAKDVGGTSGRQVHFLPHNGQAFVQYIEHAEQLKEMRKTQPRKQPSKPPVESRFELFD